MMFSKFDKFVILNYNYSLSVMNGAALTNRQGLEYEFLFVYAGSGAVQL